MAAIHEATKTGEQCSHDHGPAAARGSDESMLLAVVAGVVAVTQTAQLSCQEWVLVVAAIARTPAVQRHWVFVPAKTTPDMCSLLVPVSHGAVRV